MNLATVVVQDVTFFFFFLVELTEGSIFNNGQKPSIQCAQKCTLKRLRSFHIKESPMTALLAELGE